MIGAGAWSAACTGDQVTPGLVLTERGRPVVQWGPVPTMISGWKRLTSDEAQGYRRRNGS